jgi:hypothetical protein
MPSSIQLIIWASVFAIPTFGTPGSTQEASEVSFRAIVHQYLDKKPDDPFSKIKEEIEKGLFSDDYGNPLDYIESILGRLKISKHSQQLVFSTTSLQLSRISPRNPRAIYFNDDLYLGYVPGGQIEVIGIDPEIGAIPYIFSLPISNDPKWRPKVIRSRRCMNCHANSDIGGIPGLLLSSVVPGPGGGSLDAFRQKQSGHAVPFDQRFGGWHLTGEYVFPSSWANSTGVMKKSEITKIPNLPGSFFEWKRYLVPSSDVIASLLLEHQVGFINRCIGASYRIREALDQDTLTPAERNALMNREADTIVEYTLFAKEVSLPKPISTLNSFFAMEFENREGKGAPLRRLSLKTRLMQKRCSYMIHSQSFQGLRPELKAMIFSKIKNLMTTPKSGLSEQYSYFEEMERKEIDKILSDSIPDYAKIK